MKAIFFIISFIVIPTANAGVYKWTDKNGDVHFGDHPVNQNEAIELIYDTESRAGITNSSGNTKERDRMIKELENDRKERESMREEKRVAQKKRNRRCARYKKELAMHERANSIYRLAKNGVRVYYTDSERDDQRKKINRSIVKNCR